MAVGTSNVARCRRSQARTVQCRVWSEAARAGRTGRRALKLAAVRAHVRSTPVMDDIELGRLPTKGDPVTARCPLSSADLVHGCCLRRKPPDNGRSSQQIRQITENYHKKIYMPSLKSGEGVKPPKNPTRRHIQCVFSALHQRQDSLVSFFPPLMFFVDIKQSNRLIVTSFSVPARK